VHILKLHTPREQRPIGDTEVHRHRLLVRANACLYLGLQRQTAVDAYLQLTYNILSGGCTWAQMWNVPVTVCRTHAEGDVDVAVNSRVKQGLLSTDHAVYYTYSTMHH